MQRHWAATACNSCLPDPFVITFYDGFEDFDRSALPPSKRYHFAATLYVATGFGDKTSHWLVPEHEEKRPMLNWKQLNQIAAAGIECGAHTHTHLRLDNVSLEVARHEICTSKQLFIAMVSPVTAVIQLTNGRPRKSKGENAV